jgi:L-lactate dehydrogenase
VYIGVPAIVNAQGIKEVIEWNLSPEELSKFQQSVKTLEETYVNATQIA